MKQRLRRRFRALLVLQVVLLGAVLVAMATVMVHTAWLGLPLLLALLALLQTGLLLRSVQRHVDTLEEFFAAVSYEDFTRRFVEDDVDSELRGAFNRILSRFQDTRAERDLQAAYLATVVRHIPLPFVSARADGRITLSNHPARKLTGLSTLTHLDDFAALDEDLPAQLRATPAGEQRLVLTHLRGVPAELRISVSALRQQGEVERLYSLENLSGELTARESAAWRNLIRVLTHEIMNTLTPITSLAETTVELMDDVTAREEVREAVQTIGRRSEGLMRFVSRYRELLKVPEPEFAPVPVQPLFASLRRLQSVDLASVAVTTRVYPESLEVVADARLVELVLINVLRNALDAVAGVTDAAITLDARLDFGRTVLSVEDNGCGIAADLRDQVFIPFFTTKREGSGIGLSLSRQIMTAHGGQLVLEPLARGTRVKLVFV